MHRIATGMVLAAGMIAGSAVSAPAQVYGYYNLPPGSYQQSCSNERMNGPTLSAACSAGNGRQVYSSLNVSRCNGDIANNNGYLTCNGYNGGYGNGGYYGNNRRDDDENDRDDNGNNGRHRGNGYYRHGRGSRDNGNDTNGGYNGSYYNGGYGYGLPPGSYQQSCTSERMNGSMLSASCTAPNGAWIGSTIDVRQCRSRGTDIANRNGYLSC